MSEYYAMIGQRLRRHREALRLSRRQVVEEMRRHGYRISVSSLQDFEEGRRLNLQVLMQLAEVLRRHPAELLGLSVPDDVGLEELDSLVRRSSRLSPYEKEFLYAAIYHIERLRSRGAFLESPRPADSAPESVRQSVLALLRRGGAFSVKEMAEQPELEDVPETLIHREVLHLLREGLLEAVTARPLRYILARLPRQAERQL